RRGVVRRIEQAFLDVRGGDAFDGVAELLGDELGGVGIDHVGDLHHLALLHEQADDVDCALRHAVREFLDGDRLGDGDFADELLLRFIVDLALLPLDATAEGGDGTLTHFSGVERGHHREAAAVLLGPSARGPRRGCGAGGSAGAAAAARTREFVVLGFGYRVAEADRHACGLLRLVVAEALLGFLLGLALGLVVVPPALFLLALARLCGFTLYPLARVALAAAALLLCPHAAFLGLANLRALEGAGARTALFLGQSAQHDAAGGLRGRRRLGGRSRCSACGGAAPGRGAGRRGGLCGGCGL